MHSNYSGFATAKPNGEVFASAPHITKPISIADRPWFQRLVQTRSFVIGEYSIGRFSGKPSIVLGYPLLDPTGQLLAVFTAGLDLRSLQQTLLKINLPDGANFNIIDSNGTIIIRFPDPEKFVGKKMLEESIVKTMLTKKEGVMEEVGLDGVPRLFGYTTVGSGFEAIHISVGIPEQAAYTDLNPSSWFLSKKRVVVAVSGNAYLIILACWVSVFFEKSFVVPKSHI